MAFRGRFRSFDFWDGTVFGAALMSVLFSVGVWAFVSLGPEHWAWLATLLAIPAALIGAGIALWTTRYQMNRQREQDLASARAVLPLVVSRVCTYCISGVQFFGDPYSDQNLNEWENIESKLQFSSEDLSALRDAIRVVDPITREWISILIARYQVAMSRSRDFLSYHHPGRAQTSANDMTKILLKNIPHVLFDWSLLYAISENMFEFARGGKESVSSRLDLDRIGYAIRSQKIDMNFDEIDEERLEQYIKKFGDGSVEHFRFRPFWLPPTS